MNTITIANLEIPFRPEDEMYSLTEIWRQVTKDQDGKPDENKRPQYWLRIQSTQAYIIALQKKLGHTGFKILCGERPFYTISRSKHIGTYANWMMTLAYCHYLKPELGIEIYGYFTRIRAGDVTLIEEIYHNATDEGKKWIEKRMAGKVKHRELTDTLRDHGVTGQGYADCTNAEYKEILGGTAVQVRTVRNIPAKAALRDNLSSVELGMIDLTETIAAQKIHTHNIQGTYACAQTCGNAGRTIKQAVAGFLAS